MKKYKLLDLFCGAGGASMGYHYAGFEVEGVDIKPQPHYPFKFYQADALTFPLEGYDAYHASPPCQKFSGVQNIAKDTKERRGKLLDLLTPMRELLRATAKPYIIENVVGAPMLEPIMLCGVMFNLKVLRHRLFESNIAMFQPIHLRHNGTVTNGQYMTVASMGGAFRDGKGNKRKGSRKTSDWKVAMGIDWMDRYELTQSIPPAYTEYIGKHLIKHLDGLRQ